MVYRALGVPDVLTEENQLRAAGARFLKLVWGDTVRLSEVSGPDRNRHLALASRFVTEAADHLRNHELDPVIGGYTHFVHSANLAGPLHQSADVDLLLEGKEGERWAAVLIAHLRGWFDSNPDALRELS